MTITAPAPTVTKRELAEAAMRRSWFPVARISDLDTPQRATLLGVKLVVYRDGQGRIADPAEISAAVAFLASDGAAFITGQTLAVNGGALIPSS